MKRALALAAVAAAVVLALSGCRSGLRNAGVDTGGGAVPAATSVTTDGKATGGKPASSVDNNLSKVDQELSTVDSQLNQADQAADSDN